MGVLFINSSNYIALGKNEDYWSFLLGVRLAFILLFPGNLSFRHFSFKLLFLNWLVFCE